MPKFEEMLKRRAYDADEEQKLINSALVKFRKRMPNLAQSFMNFWRESKKGDAIPLKMKELMALAIVIVEKCKPCIFLHTKICIEVGASDEEILETAGVALSMGGGPVYEYIGYVVEALEYYKNNRKEV